MKGDPDCKCECCIYWRRHIHRVVLNKDGAIKILNRDKRRLESEKQNFRYRCNYIGTIVADKQKTINMLRQENRKLKQPLVDKLIGWFM